MPAASSLERQASLVERLAARPAVMTAGEESAPGEASALEFAGEKGREVGS